MTELFVNGVFQSSDNGHLYRILWISNDRNIVWIYDLDKMSVPETAEYSALSEKCVGGLIDFGAADPYVDAVTDNNLSSGEKSFRDSVWCFMEAVVLNEPDIYDKHSRGRITSEAAQTTGKTLALIYKYLKRYWKYGKTKNAFLPNFQNCGGGGKERKANEAKRGRPRKYGNATGINIDDVTKRIFEKAIKKYYHTRDEYTLTDAYRLMLKEHYTKFEAIPDGTVAAQPLSEDSIPTLRQFRYWYDKKYGVQEKLTKRKGEAKFSLEHRAITGKSDFGIMGPGAKYQIDATIGDIYLISRFNRADIIGRPVIYFIIDVFSRMVAGMYVGLEGPSWAGAMMAIANACSDKAKYCAEYGITITQEEWPCYHVPGAILGDRGEMESKSVETLINALNVRVENAPAYRADMKGIIEQYFHTINGKAVAFLPGHVKPDMSERGGRDYRLDAKLDIKQLTKILIQCVLYHNNQHFLESYERSADMVSDGIVPIPIKLWEWGIGNCSGALRTFPEETVKLALMPTAQATVTAKGIKFKNLYYLCERAANERWFETARAKGSYKVDISYDPRNMGNIYVHESGGAVDKCWLAEWQDKYIEMTLDEITYLQESEKLMRRQHSTAEYTAGVDLSAVIDNVVAEAEEMAKQTVIPESKSGRIKNIRENRKTEKQHNRHDEAFVLGDDDAAQVPEPILQPAVHPEQQKISPALAIIMRQLEERLNGQQ